MTNISILQTDTLIYVPLTRRRGVNGEFVNNIFLSTDNNNNNNFFVSICFHIRVQRRHVLANYAASASFNDMIFLPSGQWPPSRVPDLLGIDNVTFAMRGE